MTLNHENLNGTEYSQEDSVCEHVMKSPVCCILSVVETGVEGRSRLGTSLLAIQPQRSVGYWSALPRAVLCNNPDYRTKMANTSATPTFAAVQKELLNY